MSFLGLFGKNLADTAAPLLHDMRPLISSDQFKLFGLDNTIGQYLQSDELHILINGIVFDSRSGKRIQPRDVLIKYERNGDEALECLDGSYTIIIWNATTSELLITRDVVGAKLLYYRTETDDSLFFSNSLHDLLLLTRNKKISHLGLVEYLRFLDISPPHTIYEGIWSLEPGELISAKPGELTIHHKPKRTPNIPLAPRDFMEAEAQFEAYFRASIARRIEDSGTVGAFLSGGIDSSLICAVAGSIRPDLQAYTVGFVDPAFDESGIARRVASHLGIAHEVLIFGEESDLQAFHDFTSSIPSPFADPAIIPTYQCFKKITGKVDIILDGTGADTLVGIMPAKHVRFILGYSRHTSPVLRNIVAKMLRWSRVSAGYADLFAFEDAAELLIRWKGWSRNEITRLVGTAASLDHTLFFRAYRENPKLPPYELYSALMGVLPDDRLHQSAAMVGQEVALPFTDRAVQDYVKELPLEFKYATGADKRLFRSLLGKYVPESIWNVPKHGFDYPFVNLLKRNHFSLVDQYLSRNALGWHDLFDYDMVKDVVERFKAGDHSVRFKVWGLTLFQSWYYNYYRKL